MVPGSSPGIPILLFKMQDLIARIRKELYSKPAPGEVLNNITDKKLVEIASKYPHNNDALWLGTYLADLFITEAKDTGDITKHVPMAVEYTKQLIIDEKISDEIAEILIELIETHHGGPQKHIESKLFKNADCFKFLDPKGVFHIFGVFYEETEESFKKAIEYTMFKVEEKYHLVDLDDELKAEAKELYDRWQWFFKRLDYRQVVPELYQNK